MYLPPIRFASQRMPLTQQLRFSASDKPDDPTAERRNSVYSAINYNRGAFDRQDPEALIPRMAQLARERGASPEEAAADAAAVAARINADNETRSAGTSASDPTVE